MAFFRKFFCRKPPDGLLEISERVYVFTCCITTDILGDDKDKGQIADTIVQLRSNFPEASFMVFNFRDEENPSQVASILSNYDIIVMDYPRQYERCPLLTLEIIHHFLRSSESWLLLGQQNALLMHCEQGGWPLMAFMLSALLIYSNQSASEQKTLDMIYKQAPRELLQMTSPLNPLPSQLRYLQYISRKNLDLRWPPLDRALRLDCVILRVIPTLDGKGPCCPIFKIYGPDPSIAADRTPKVLYEPPKTRKLRNYMQENEESVKIDIGLHVQGDVVLECISLCGDPETELMTFRVMFNTAFIRSNILILTCNEIDTLWKFKDQFPKEFRAEILFSEVDSATSIPSFNMLSLENKYCLTVGESTKVQSGMESLDTTAKNDAAPTMLQYITAPQEHLDDDSHHKADTSNVLVDSTLEKVQTEPNPKSVSVEFSSPCIIPDEQYMSYSKELLDNNSSREKVECLEQSVVPPSMTFKPFSDMNLNREKVVTPISPLSTPTSMSSDEKLTREKVAPDESMVVRQTISLPSLDASSIQWKGRLQDSQIGLQRPFASKIISQRAPQTSVSSPVSHCSSLQGSLLPTSRYHKAAGAIGITALLHDHASYSADEVLSPVTLSLPSSTIPSPVTNAPKAVKLSHVSSLMRPTLPPPPPASVKSSVVALTPAGTMHSHPLPLHQAPSEAADPSSKHYPVLSADRVQSVQVPTPPPSIPSLFEPSASTYKCTSSIPPPPPPPLPVSFSRVSLSVNTSSSSSLPSPPPLPPQFFPRTSPSLTVSELCTTTPPSSVDLSATISDPPQLPASNYVITSAPHIASPPPPQMTGCVLTTATSLPQLPQSSCSSQKDSSSSASALCSKIPPVPPPPFPFPKGLPKAGDARPLSHFGVGSHNVPGVPALPSSASFGAKGRGVRSSLRNQVQQRKANLKPYHWLKMTRALQGSLWAEAQKSDEASKTPEFDISELESLFSASNTNSDNRNTNGKPKRCMPGPKSDKVQLIDLRRAYNCEIMLSKVKIPLSDLMSFVLALDDSALDGDQVDNLIKFCPTKEEMELLKGYSGDKENLGKCEQFFLECMKVPRVESKLRILSFKLQFHPQVSDLRNKLSVINSASEEIRSSLRLKRIMQSILSLGNALNHGTARGSAIGFRLDSLLKLTDTRACDSKMTLMHYLCKVLADKFPELLDFPKDLVNLETATKIQLKNLAEEMQAVNKGIEKLKQELTASETDGRVSATFYKTLKLFLSCAETEAASLASLYSTVGRNADALALYFGEDPARCPFEQVVSTLLNFVRMFIQAHKENCKQQEFEKKKAEKDAGQNEKLKKIASKKESHKVIGGKTK
ncbi:hypothetical protein K2173_026013 [Erythroxylum novogranatense]|uniref:Formin-like protein n=1 Tax=Erythroxylum novogranatense TaxID=1862640 RepID=A0AAV8SIG4_9ROSI|nr:hypothetical protein K2173_026013 [Erythroxylum novogranatense]